MNEIKDILNFAGWGGVAFFLLWKFGPKWMRKEKDEPDKLLEELDRKIKLIEERMPLINQHLHDSTERVRDLGILKENNNLNNQFMKETMERLEKKQDKLFEMFGELKTLMIQRGGN